MYIGPHKPQNRSQKTHIFLNLIGLWYTILCLDELVFYYFERYAHDYDEEEKEIKSDGQTEKERQTDRKTDRQTYK